MASIFLPGHSTVAAKIEAAEGTPIALAAADAKILANDIAYDPDLPFFPRDPATQYPDSYAGTSGGPRTASLSMETKMSGSGVAGTAPAESALLQALGFSETIVVGTSVAYAPVIAGSAISVAWDVLKSAAAAVRMSIYGARGSGSFDFVCGEPPLFKPNLSGIWQLPAATPAVLAGVPYTTVPQAVMGGAVTLDAIAVAFKTLTINVENEVGLREDPALAPGGFSFCIGKKRITGIIDPAMDDPATYDAFTQMTTHNEGALSLVIGAIAGNIITVTAPKVQYREVKITDRNGYLVTALAFQCNISTGNDSFVITYT